MIDDVIEPFKLPALERISKIVGDYFTGFEITGLFKKSGYPEIVHDGSTKWRFLCSTFENLQKRKFGPYIILKFLETTCDPQEYFEKPESHIAILHKLNDVLSFYGMKINEKGKVIKIKEKRDTIAMTSKNDPESTSDQTIVRINISPTQGYAGDNIVLEAWASEPDTAVHLDIIDENDKRQMSTGQVIFTNPFKHVLTLSKHNFGPGKYNAVFYTTNIKVNKTGTFEFLTSEAKLETMLENTSESKYTSLITDKQWDVFISHASEDKETVAKPFAEKLRSLDLNVWYDEFSLKWGKSLRKSIDEGLSNSLFGIVILSKVFFQKKWTQIELDGLISIMTSTGQDNILPLRYEISNEEVAEVSPTLAGIFSRSWDEGIEKLAIEVKDLVGERKIKFSSNTETPRPSHSSSSKPFDPKEIEKEVRKAKESAIPRMVINPNSVTSLPNPTQSKSAPSRNPHKKRDFTIVAIIISVVAAFMFSPYFSDFISPPTPEIHVTDLNALDGIVEGNSPIYSYEPRTLIPNGTKNETFFLTISNSGGVHAKNFWIDIYEKPDGQWFDFHTSAVVHSGTPKNCQNKSSLCTIELIPKETGSIELQYGVSFDHKLYQKIVDETPKLFFKYGFDDAEEQLIEISLKFD